MIKSEALIFGVGEIELLFVSVGHISPPPLYPLPFQLPENFKMIIDISSLVSSDCFDNLQRVLPHDRWDRVKSSPPRRSREGNEFIWLALIHFARYTEVNLCRHSSLSTIICAKKSAMVTCCPGSQQWSAALGIKLVDLTPWQPKRVGFCYLISSATFLDYTTRVGGLPALQLYSAIKT